MSRSPGRRVAVLGAVHRFGFAQLAPFVRSCRAHVPDADLILFLNRTPPGTRAALEAEGVRVFPFHAPLVRLRNPVAYGWPIWRGLFPLLPGLEAKKRLGRIAFNLMCLRFVLYHDFLAAVPGRYDQILLSDVRDVIFQGDPFARTTPNGLSFFLETKRIGDCPYNGPWIRRCFGDGMFERLRGEIISCAGVTIGSGPGMQDYLERLLGLLFSVRAMDPVAGDDQAAHNVLAYLDPDLPVHRFANHEGPVLTLGIGDAGHGRDPEGRVVDRHGRVVPVLHQYDRIPELRGLADRWRTA